MTASADAHVDRDVAFERKWLDEHTWVDIARGFIVGAPAAYDALTTAVPWSPRQLWRYERWVEEPRVSHGYRVGQPWPHQVLVDTHRALQTQYGVTFDGFSLIWYRDGNDCQAFHRDRDMRYTEDTLVGILSLGARRPWLLRRSRPARQVDRRERRRGVRPLPRRRRPVRARRPGPGRLGALGREGPGWRGPVRPHLGAVALDLGNGPARAGRLVRGASQLLAPGTRRKAPQ